MHKMNRLITTGFLMAVVWPVWGQQQMKAEDTEFYEPVPPKVHTHLSEIPSDAIVLFDGNGLDAWESIKNPGQPAGWVVNGGVLTVHKPAGHIRTKQHFTDFQIHLEFYIPTYVGESGQARGNSGLYLAAPLSGSDGYELQILDSYENETYVNGQVGSVYKQGVPLANPSRPNGYWQVYDVVWTAPRFHEDGTLKSPARITAFLNGVLIQHNFELKGQTKYIGIPDYVAHGPSPIKLQAHSDPSKPISFRNIWVREL